ncbi:MAG: protein kinase domain-containing protein [Blastocatellia bacterium]
MSRIFYNSQSQPIQLSHKLGTGGEGSVYEIHDQPDFVAKIYHEPPQPEKAEKLIALSRLGNERLLKLAAWPVDVLRVEADGQLAGFVMKKIGQASEVHTLHSPKSRLQKFPEASWAFLIYVAANIARAVATVHEHGFIVGDLNPKNILVTHQATVALLDCDSFQVTADGKTFRCEGGFPEYLPPELQGKSLRDVERTQSHDCFGLAVVIFQLLFMGRHPFSGKFTGAGEITLEDAIGKSRFAFGADAAARQMQPPPGTLSLEAIPASLNSLFRRAFLSADRPSPQEWIEPLETLAKTLKPCDMHTGHFFFSELDECPWCEIEMRARIRLFNFSLDGHHGRRSHFKLDEVWKKIENLPTSSAQVALAESKNYLALTAIQPSAEVAAFTSDRFSRMLGGVFFAAAAGCAIGYFLPGLVEIFSESVAGYLGLWLLLALILTGFAGAAAKKIADAEFNTGKTQITNLLLKSPQLVPNNPLASEVRARFQSADQTVQQLSAQLEKMSGAANFQPKLEELRNRREVYERLPKIREFKLKHLETTARDRQLNEFLDQFEIDEAAVKDIDFPTAASLRLRGIETAADLVPDRLKQVSDLTEAQAQQLLFWRAGLKRQFKPDPTGGVQVQERITVERELDNLRMQLEHELTRGAVYLQRMVQEAGNQQQQISATLPEAYRLQAQAEKDWEVVQKQNPMWPLVVILIVFFLFGTFLSLIFPLYNFDGGAAGSYSDSSPVNATTTSPASATSEPELSAGEAEARILFEKGREMMRQAKWDAAAKLFQRATKFDPQYQAAYAQLGHALYRQGKYDESINSLLKADGMGKEFEPNFYLGLAYRAKRQWKLAAHSFQWANDLNDIDLDNNEADPNRADAYYYWGEALMKTGQIKDTIKALESSAITPLERFQLATFYLWVGKYDLARRQHDILKYEDKNLAEQLQRLMKQHSKQRGRG